jgi:predicted DNA-binding transcriptional regulator YafY
LKNDYSRLQRWLKIILLLKKGPMTVSEIARHFQVSDKTIRRDMHELECCRLPVYLSRGRCILGGSVPISGREENSSKMLRLLSNFLLGENSEKWIERINAMMDEDNPDSLFSVHVPRSSVKPEVLFALLEAMVQNKGIQMDYFKVGQKEAEKRHIFPQKLFFRKQAWYLAGWDYVRNNHRLFRLNRIAKVCKSDKAEAMPPENPGQLLNDSFGVYVGNPQNIKLLFSAEAAPYIEEVFWHKSQSFKSLENGDIEMSLFVVPDYDIKQWILSFGSGVKVLEPVELAREIALELQKALVKYT